MDGFCPGPGFPKEPFSPRLPQEPSFFHVVFVDGLTAMKDADIWQEALTGPTEFTVNLAVYVGEILDGKGFAFNHSKKLYIKMPGHGGKSDKTRTSKSELLLKDIPGPGLRMAKMIVEKLAYTGIFCIQFKQSGHSVKLIEVMGRYCASLTKDEQHRYLQQLALRHLRLMSAPRLTH